MGLIVFLNINGIYLKTIDLKCTTDEELPWMHPCYIAEPFQASDNDIINIVNDDTQFDVFQITSKSNLTFVPSTIFEKFPNLRRIHLSTGVKTISRNSFNNAHQLSAIILRENEISVVPTSVFSNTRELREIDLGMNKITEIQNYAFEGLENLRNLILSYNQLKTIRQSTFAGASNLVLLDLEHNEIESVEDGAFGVSTLNTLFLGHNKLKRLSDNIFSGAPNLLAVDLRSNGITHIGHAFSHLRELVSLILDNNEISDLKFEDFVKLPKILQLYLSGTGLKLTEAPSSHFQRTRQKTLKILDLSGNSLKNANILKYLTPFSELEELKLDDNAFERIDNLGDIRNTFTNFKIVSLSDNEFRCDWLERTLAQLKNSQIKIYGSTSDTEQKNIDGIVCN